LNVRKRSGASLKTNATQEAPAIPILQPYHHVQNDLQALPTEDVPPTLEKQNTVLKKKKSLWFRRNTGEQEREQENKENQVKKKQSNSLIQIPEAWQGLDDRKERNDRMAFANIDNTKDDHKPSDGSIGSEFPMRNSSAATAKSESVRKGFFAFFGKKSKDDKGRRPMELGGKHTFHHLESISHTDISAALNFSSSSILSNFDIGSDNNNNDNARAGPPEVQMNWLSRFLHIKPASKTLCFHIGRGKVRQDLVRLLRDWQRFGVQDVSLDREVNSISARIDKSNRKYLPRACLMFSAWCLRDRQFEVELLEAGLVWRCNAAFVLLLLASHLLTPMSYRPQDQARNFCHRALRRTRTRTPREPLPRTLHANPRRSLQFSKGCRYRRRRLPRSLHVGRG
jgi:hypothetical protein